MTFQPELEERTEIYELPTDDGLGRLLSSHKKANNEEDELADLLRETEPADAADVSAAAAAPPPAPATAIDEAVGGPNDQDMENLLSTLLQDDDDIPVAPSTSARKKAPTASSTRKKAPSLQLQSQQQSSTSTTPLCGENDLQTYQTVSCARSSNYTCPSLHHSWKSLQAIQTLKKSDSSSKSSPPPIERRCSATSHPFVAPSHYRRPFLHSRIPCFVERVYASSLDLR